MKLDYTRDLHQKQFFLHLLPQYCDMRAILKLDIQIMSIPPIGYFKSPVGIGIGDLFADSALPDSEIPNV